ncbi:Zf-CCCH domain protein [Rhizoctonia solani]|uniref:Zf-CCCH domain protein n=1 Tax=Rhizoctonia solani TaxID=456999 RepID=A0A8H8NRP8_9AGAM|nr:Zf-CCCH domain protein [Rhizoctonia solani]QRW17012.1 Zf-CCCH domain protein [Rhizoctonia solani]
MDDAGDKYGHIRAYLAVLQREHNSKSPTGDSDGPEVSNAGLAAKIASLLAEEKEDEVKNLLAEKLSIPESSPDLDAYVLEFMHKHKDDIDGISLVSLATPTRRPLSRASSTSFRLPRPDTPSASGSPLSTSFRRPHTPASVTSPLAANLQAYALGNSPSASPTLGHATTHAFPGVIGGLSGSRPASPLPSPRHLNAKALEFRPGMLSRQASAMSGSLHRDTPSPDVWGHGSPHKGTSNLAIAAPLVPSDSFYPRPLTPGSSLGSSFPSSAPSAIPTQPGVSSSLSPPGIGPSPLSSDSPVPSAAVPVPTSGVLGNRPRHNSFDDEDEFSPFGTRPPGTITMDIWRRNGRSGIGIEGYDDPLSLTPLEVLARIFGPSVSHVDLEDALSQAGWEFDNAVALLMERTKPGSKAIQVKAPPATGQTPSQVTRSSGVAVVPRETFVQTRGATKGQAVAGKATTNSGSTAANRVCRYYLAGECRRADCRFRACSLPFWLRSQCAKGEHCEFLHTLPQESDVSGIVNSMARTDLGPVDAPVEEPPVEDFPLLGRSSSAAPKHDPGRSRFASAVKKGTPAPTRTASGTNTKPAAAPRSSPRIRLRPPSLLPTLPTGDMLNNMYMTYRQRAIQLGAARNACLSRAADAWRRGDGAAAKRFSKDAHELNRKMVDESGEAARKIVRERVRTAVDAVRHRDASWSDDPRDRAERGKMCGGELGVVLGVASMTALGENGKGLRAEERMECLLDLHGLHAAEGVEALQDFLLELEKEQYFGLAYVIVGEEKHTGTQDAARGASKARLGTAVREWLSEWAYPWSERGGVLAFPRSVRPASCSIPLPLSPALRPLKRVQTYMADLTTQISPSHPSVGSDMGSESFIVRSESMAIPIDEEPVPPRPESPSTEKQGLLEALDQAHSALSKTRAENDDLREQLATAEAKAQDQADQIAMLRSKVEEARRGVMRLQTENRRASQLQAAANSQELRTSKRASFILPPTPASPGGLSPGKHIHRRISSMSEPSLADQLRLSGSPSSFVTSFPEHISGRVTPPGPSAEDLRKFAPTSETAVRALREFIAENAVGETKSNSGSEGLQGLRLPPLPSDADVADVDATPKKSEEPKRGWGSWLKRGETSNSIPRPNLAPVSSAISLKVTPEDESVPASATSTTPDKLCEQLDQEPHGFARFFGKTTSAASTPAVAPVPLPDISRSSTPASHIEARYEPEGEESKHVPPPLQLRREGSQRDSVSTATTDDPEPISPPADMVDIALDHRRPTEKEEFAGERTPTVASTTGFAM